MIRTGHAKNGRIASQRLIFVFAWIRLGERYDDASKPVYRRQNRFWPGTHTDIIRQVHPTNRAGRIHEEFRGARDVFAFCAAAPLPLMFIPAMSF